jgi:hypothetical protein
MIGAKGIVKISQCRRGIIESDRPLMSIGVVRSRKHKAKNATVQIDPVVV